MSVSFSTEDRYASTKYTSFIGRKICKALLHSIAMDKIDGKEIPYIPLQKWFSVWLQLNLFNHLTVQALDNGVLGDISTGSWFPEFLNRTPNGYLPVALDVYYDHWKVSKNKKLGGLYFSLANLPPHLLMKPDNKFVCCLVPTGTDIQAVLLKVLMELIAHKGKFTINVDNVTVNIYLEIARIVGDIPGLSEMCALLGHSAISCCRNCYILKKHLLDFETHYKAKNQADLAAILANCITALSSHQYVPFADNTTTSEMANPEMSPEEAKSTLQENGLKGKIPIWMKLGYGSFDMISAAVNCLMHNEELGLLQLELKLYIKGFSKRQTFFSKKVTFTVRLWFPYFF